MIIVLIIFCINIYFEWQNEQNQIEQIKFEGTWNVTGSMLGTYTLLGIWTFYENLSLKVIESSVHKPSPSISFSVNKNTNTITVADIEKNIHAYNPVCWGKYKVENDKLYVYGFDDYDKNEKFKYNFVNNGDIVEIETDFSSFYFICDSFTMRKTQEIISVNDEEVKWSDFNITISSAYHVNLSQIKLARSEVAYNGNHAPVEWGEIRTGDVLTIGNYHVTLTVQIRYLPTSTTCGFWSFNKIKENDETGKIQNVEGYEISDLDYWEKTYGGAEDDWGWEVQQTNDNGFIISGYTESYGNGMSDIWLIKTDDEGNKEWDKTYGETKSDKAKSVQQTRDGGYIIAGDSFVIGKSSDIRLIKTDYEGNREWDKTYGGTSHETAYHVQQTQDDGYIVVGNRMKWNENVTSGILLIKVDKDGDKDWEKAYGSETNDVGNYVQQTDDGGYILTGKKDMDKREQYTNYDMFIIKTDSQGNIEWEKIIGGEIYSDEGKCIIQTSDGGYIFSGNTISFGIRSEDAWLIKLDENGNIKWNKTYGGAYYDRAEYVEETSDGGFIFAGGKSLSSFLNWDTWIVKTDSDGDVEWTKTFTGNERDICWAVHQTSDEGYVMTGYTESNCNGNMDVWLIKIDTD